MIYIYYIGYIMYVCTVYIYNVYNHILYNILLCIIFIHILEATNPQFPRCCCPIRFKGVATTEIRFTEVGLSSFSLFGNVCVLLAPLVDSVPIFAGGQHSFRSWIWYSELLVTSSTYFHPVYIYIIHLHIFTAVAAKLPAKLGSLQPHKAVCELWFCGMMKNPICKWWKILSENEFERRLSLSRQGLLLGFAQPAYGLFWDAFSHGPQLVLKTVAFWYRLQQ